MLVELIRGEIIHWFDAMILLFWEDEINLIIVVAVMMHGLCCVVNFFCKKKRNQERD